MSKARELMPEVAKKVDEYRARWGKAHVDECIRRGMAGEADQFYAFEGGHTVGTPFTLEAVQQYLQTAFALGGKFAVAMRPPGKGGGNAA